MSKYLDLDGLEHFYDGIKDQIGSASQEQVDAWLDEHPEATTTVQDGAITTAKLANGAVTFSKLSDELKLDIVGGEFVTLTPVNGSYATYNGWQVTNSTFFVTEPITLAAGAKVRIFTQGYLTNVAALSKVGNTAEPNKPFTPIVVAQDSTAQWYSATITEDGSYVVSGNVATTPQLIIENNVDGKIQSVRDAAGIYSLTPTMVVGTYATYNGWSVSNNQFYVSAPFQLNAGDFIRVYAKGYLTNVAVLARISNPDNPSRPYTAAIVSTDSTAKWYETKVTEGGTYVVSGMADTQPEVTICKSGETVEPIQYCDFSVFRRFGVIGDSYASGELVFNNQYVDNYSISWGQVLARMCGNVCTNYSAGGLTTRSWLTNARGLTLVNSSTAEDLYIMALGINDRSSLGIDYIGSITDITSHTSYADYPDTFYGNYGKIIEQVLAHAPHAKVIMLTIFTQENNAQVLQFNAAIKEIAEHYGFPYIEQNDYPFFLTPTYTNMSGGHPRAVAYSGMAATFKKIIEDLLVSDHTYFDDLYMYDNA